MSKAPTYTTEHMTTKHSSQKIEVLGLTATKTICLIALIICLDFKVKITQWPEMPSHPSNLPIPALSLQQKNCIYGAAFCSNLAESE